MEKFEIDDEKRLEVFNNFVGKARDALTTLIEDIKFNIKKYEQAIEDTTKEIEDSESSKEKCENEIVKMEGKIDSIKENIDNVENTYKKIVDAYSSTSKGETKELYSDIIDGAKANCEKDVEKNRTEIARLNSDIDAIKNNITEFTRNIEELNRDLEGYKLEIFKYNKALDYMEKCSEKTSSDLEVISLKKEEPKKKSEPKVVKKTEKKITKDATLEADEIVIEDTDVEEDDTTGGIEIIIDEPVLDNEENSIIKETEETNEVELLLEEPEKNLEINSQETKEIPSFEDSLKQIYDLTGYKPKKEEETIEEVNREKVVYSDNLESLFTNSPNTDIKPEKVISTDFDENDMSEWERILNGADDILTSLTPNIPKEEPVVQKEIEVKKTIKDNIEDTINQLLKPYGTSFERLSSLISDKITYKDGTILPFEMNVEDVVKAVNAVDGNDLKMMKTVGPEITLLRKVKHMKEGKM